MHVILSSLGSDGDILPYVGLGAKLLARGHRVTLVAGEHYRSLATKLGFAFRMLVSETEHLGLIGHRDFWHPTKGARVGAKWTAKQIPRQYALLAEFASDPEALFVSNPAIFGSWVIHEKFGAPLVTLVLQPWMILSSLAPPVMPGLPSLRGVPRPALNVFWRLVDAAGYWLIGRHLNRFRASLGLKPVRRLFQNWLSPQLVLGLFPDWYGPPQADWPPQVRLTGFPRFNGEATSELSMPIQDFCRAGPPPVVVTFGTGMMHATAAFRVTLEACQMLDLRAIVLTRYPAQLPESLPPFARHFTYAPFRRLFANCAAVVHHGGIGTLAEALFCGTPQFILPFAFDQMDNATRVETLGVGTWLKRRQRPSRAVAEALTRVMTAQTRDRCRVVAARFGNEDTLELAADYVEQLKRR